jgi:hypothetical protein
MTGDCLPKSTLQAISDWLLMTKNNHPTKYSISVLIGWM